MFTAVESEYLRGLISSYKSLGYDYYLAHTITQSDSNYDFAVYFSKNKITSSSSSDFNLPDNSIIVYVDSSSRNENTYNPSLHSRDVLSYASGNLHIDIAEFIYTNAEVSYTTLFDTINPDISFSGVSNYENTRINLALLFVVCSIFLYMFIKSILRVRR